MAATFRTRPWLLSTVRPSLSPAVVGKWGLVASIEHTRQYGSPARRKRIDSGIRSSIRLARKTQSQQEATSTITKEMMDTQTNVDVYEMAVIAPGTIVPLSLSKLPMDIKYLCRYFYEVVKQRIADRYQIFIQAWQLKERFWHRATFRAERKGIKEVALRLHESMSSDRAQGGAEQKVRVQEYCVPKLARTLLAAMDARPEGKQYTWSRAKVIWTRIVDHKWTEVDVGTQMSFVQAVVGIKSLQHLSNLGRNNEVLNTKTMELVEYLVLWRSVDKDTRNFGDWKIYGTLRETTLEDILKEQEMLKEALDATASTKLRSIAKEIGHA